MDAEGEEKGRDSNRKNEGMKMTANIARHLIAMTFSPPSPLRPNLPFPTALTTADLFAEILRLIVF